MDPNRPTRIVRFFLYRDWLPRHLAGIKLLTAWRVHRKLGAALIAYKYPKPVPRTDSPGTSLSSDGDTHTAVPDEIQISAITAQPQYGNQPATATDQPPVTLMMPCGGETSQ